jgi:hypothetical protein
MNTCGRRLLTGALIALALNPVAIYSQALNPTYLAHMPAPVRVLEVIKGKDAEDTLERQMGAMHALVDVIDDMAYGISHRYVSVADNTKATPDEKRIRLAYQTAYAELWYKAKEKDTYEHDRELRNEILQKLFSEDFRKLYFQSNQSAAKAFKDFQDKMYATPAAPTSTPISAAPLSSGGPAAPGSTGEMRQCVASGRTMRVCMSEGMDKGFNQMFGIDLSGLQATPPTGLRMTGDYKAADGFRLIFEPDQVTMVCKGVPAPTPYTVQVTDTQANITIQNGKPFVVSLRADGKLAGTGQVRVTGQVPAGTRTEQTTGNSTQTATRTRELTPLEAGQYPNAKQNGQTFTIQDDASQFVNGPSSRTVIDFVTKTADCTLGVLSPIGASPLQQVKNDADILTTIGAGLGALMKGGDLNAATKEMLAPKEDEAITPGLRMNGSYASGSFGLTFHRESVTMACGDSEQALPYSVQHSGNKTMLMIQDKPTMQLMPDGSLNGSGTVQVNGRIITGTTDDINNPFVFALHPASCPMGRLVAGAKITAAPVDTASIAAALTAATTPATPAGTTSLRIAAHPVLSSLLAGKSLVVLKDSLENVLASAGVNAQGASSRIAAWAKACERASTDPLCQKGVTSLASFVVARSTLDPTGTATFMNIPSSGTFFVVVDTAYSQHLLWNLRIDLKPGVNSVTLTENNTTPINR